MKNQDVLFATVTIVVMITFAVVAVFHYAWLYEQCDAGSTAACILLYR